MIGWLPETLGRNVRCVLSMITQSDAHKSLIRRANPPIETPVPQLGKPIRKVYATWVLLWSDRSVVEKTSMSLMKYLPILVIVCYQTWTVLYCIVLYCIVLCLCIYIAPLGVHTNQKRFQCEWQREKKYNFVHIGRLRVMVTESFVRALFVASSWIFVAS